MSRNPKRRHNRNRKIFNKYNQLLSEQYNGKSKYRFEVILDMLADQFDLEPTTIAKIINAQLSTPQTK